MKKVFWIFLASVCPAICFAQGKLQLAVNSLHLVYYGAGTGPLAGTAVSPTNMPAGITLVADLYGGTASSSLTLVSTTTFIASQPGRFGGGNVTLNNPALPGGTVAWFQIQIRDAAYSNATAAASGGSYAGFSQVFSAVPQPSSFNPIYQTTSPVFSTWDPGTFNMDSLSPGYRGAIAVGFSIISPPTILVNPVSRTVPIGAFVKFDVLGSGAPPLHYQWLNGTNEIAGATNTSLMFTNAQPSQSGDYSARVSNGAGSVMSATATLSVLLPLEVRMVPALSLFGTVGQTYQLEYKNLGELAWLALVTVEITNTGQLYYDLSAPGQSGRIYRLVELH